MAAKVYSVPTHIQEPVIDYVTFTQEQIEQEESLYINRVKKYLKVNECNQYLYVTTSVKKVVNDNFSFFKSFKNDRKR